MEELMDDEQELIDHMGPHIQELISNFIFAIEDRINIDWTELDAHVVLSPSIGKEMYVFINPIHPKIKTITTAVHKPNNVKLAIKELTDKLIMKKPVRIERIDDYSFRIKGLFRKD